MEEAELETSRLAQESARLLTALEFERRKPTATVDDAALSDLRRQLQKSNMKEADARQHYQAACREVEALEAELGRVRHDMANEKTKSVNAITHFLLKTTSCGV
jgi:dipeptidase